MPVPAGFSVVKDPSSAAAGTIERSPHLLV
jgi:hypothetical protein